MSEQDSGIAALKREWLVTRIVLIAGFSVAIAGGIYLGIAWRNRIVHVREQVNASIAKQEAAENKEAAAQKTEEKQATEFCAVTLAAAQKLGIVPGFAKLTHPLPQSTKTTGRYVCDAASPSSQFRIAGDLICRDLKSGHCVSLYAVTQDGSTVLYKREK